MKLLNRLSFLYENIVFKQVIQKPYPYFVNKFTGKMSAYAETLGRELNDFIDNICFNYADQLVGLAAISIILAYINWQTGVIFIGSLLLMVLVGRHTLRLSAKYEKQFTDIQGTKTGKVVDAIANFVNVKSFQKESVETATVEKELDKTAIANNRAFFWNAVFWGSMSLFVRHLIWPTTILLNVYLFLNNRISLAELTTFLSSILVFSNYIWEVIWNVSQFNIKLARIEEAHSYLFGNTNIVKRYFADEERPSSHIEFNHSLTLHKLSFAYPDKQDTEVPSGITLAINRGEKIGVVGKSGSGKTTLTKLLLGYYPVPKGQLLIDGSETGSDDLAELISYVPQDTSLFHRSIADNIAYATDASVNQEQIIAAAKQAHAHEFIVQISDGYNALVGERGVKLSAGQRQRIAIARAFLDNKPILILDEATSALDSESEVLVQEALEALWHDKTVIAIAHRLSTLRNMDRIIVMEQGKIIEQGTHDALLQKKGKYAELWAHQSGGFLEE
jgi:ATP-binding cassette, subfamily B, bacterial